MNAIDMVAAERSRQIVEEGFNDEHDNNYDLGELRIAAACYACHGTHADVVNGVGDDAWPWDHARDHAWDKRERHDLKRRLVIAAALLVAELERVMRDEDLSAREDARIARAARKLGTG